MEEQKHESLRRKRKEERGLKERVYWKLRQSTATRSFRTSLTRLGWESFPYARCSWRTLGGARGKDLHFFRVFPPPTPPHSLWQFQLLKDEIPCSLRVPAGSTFLEEFDAMGLFLRGRVSWDLRSDSVPSLALGQSLRPWCQKGLYSTRLADGASCARTTGVY